REGGSEGRPEVAVGAQEPQVVLAVLRDLLDGLGHQARASGAPVPLAGEPDVGAALARGGQVPVRPAAAGRALEGDQDVTATDLRRAHAAARVDDLADVGPVADRLG